MIRNSAVRKIRLGTREVDPVLDLFVGSSRDLTPSPACDAIRVLYAPVSPDSEVSRLCESVLSDSELQRADRFAAGEDRALFEQRRAFRRFCGAVALGSSRPLSGIRFAKTKIGRPYLPDAPDLWFSFSSCRLGMLGAWSSTHGIGVDIEDPTRPLEAAALARRFFTVAEAEVVEGLEGVERLRVFYRFWTIKEAALKSIGEGLPYGLDAFRVELDSEPRISHSPPEYGRSVRFNAYQVDCGDCCAALVTRTPIS